MNAEQQEQFYNNVVIAIGTILDEMPTDFAKNLRQQLVEQGINATPDEINEIMPNIAESIMDLALT